MKYYIALTKSLLATLRERKLCQHCVNSNLRSQLLVLNIGYGVNLQISLTLEKMRSQKRNIAKPNHQIPGSQQTRPSPKNLIVSRARMHIFGHHLQRSIHKLGPIPHIRLPLPPLIAPISASLT